MEHILLLQPIGFKIPAHFVRGLNYYKEGGEEREEGKERELEDKDSLAEKRKRHGTSEMAQGARVLASQSEDPSCVPGTNKWWKAGDNTPKDVL